MSNSVDNRVVQMEFDNKKFEKGVKTTLGSLDKLKKSLRLEESSKGLNELQRTADRFNLESIGKAADQAGMHFTAMQVVAFTALQRITNAAMTAGKKILSALTVDMPKAGFSKYEEKMNAVQTIMFATGKSIEDVEVVLERLMEYTDETSYSFTEMSNSIGKFTSAGVDLDQAERAMEGIANWAASAGVGINNASGAFYNMSQAISAGSMKMQDWKSIINLNMNTRQFKETAIETAEEMIKMGTITRQAANAFKRARVTVDNFDSTLSKGWLSREVMLATLEKYADQTTEFGLRAFKAAQEAKTLTDMIDALKDAVSTGWSKTWEYILGDKEEAAAFFTELTNRFAALADKVTYARNKVLKFWHDNGGRTEFINGVRLLLTMFERIADVAGKAFSRVFGGKGLGKYEKFLEDNLKKYGPDSPLTKTFQKILDDENYSHLGDVLIVLSERFREWTRSLVPTNDQLEKLGHVFGGVFSIVKLFFIVISSIVRVFKPLGNGADKLSSKILDISSGIGEAIERIVDWIEKNDLIYKSLKKVYDFLAEIIGKIPGWIDLAVAKIEELTGLDLHTKRFESFSDAMKKLRDALKIVYKAAGPFIQASWQMIQPYLEDTWNKIAPKFQVLGTRIGDVVAKIINLAVRFKNFIVSVAKGEKSIDDIKEKIRQVIQPIKDWFNALRSGNPKEWFENNFKAISDWIDRVKEKLQPFVDWIIEHLAKITPQKLLFGGLGVALIVFLIGLGKLASKVGGFASALSTIADSIAGFFKGLKQKIKLDAIRKLIIAVALLAVAIGGLAILNEKYDIKKAAGTLMGLVFAIGLLIIIFSIIDRIPGEGKSIDRFASTMLALAAAVGIMVLALYGITKIEAVSDDFLTLGSIIATMAAIALLFAHFTDGKSMAKGAIFMIAFAISVKKIVEALAAIDEGVLDKVKNNVAPIAFIIGALAVVALAASNMNFGSAMSVLALAGFIFAIYKIFDAISTKEWENTNLESNVGFIMTIVALLTAAIVFIGKVLKPQEILAATAAIGIAVWSFWTIAKSFYLLDKGVTLSWDLIGKLGLLLAVIGAIAFIIAKLNGKEFKLSGNSTITIAGIAAAILAMSVAFIVLQNIPFLKMLKVAFSLGIVLIALGAAFKIAKTITGDIKPILGMSVAILAITAALGLLSNFGNMDHMFEVAFTLSGVILALGGALKLASSANKGNMGSIIVFTVALALISAALYFLAQYDWQNILLSAVGLSLVLLALGGAVALAGVGGGKGVLAILAMSVAILAISAALYVLSDVVGSGLIDSVIAMALALFVLGAAAAIFGGASSMFLMGALVIAALGAACIVLGLGLDVLFGGLEQFKTACAPLIEKIKEIFSPLQPMFEAIGEAVKKFFEVIGDVGTKIVNWFSELFGLGGDKAQEFKDSVVDTFETAGNSAQENAERIEDANERIVGASGSGVNRPSRLMNASNEGRHARPEIEAPEAPIEEATATGEAVGNAVADGEVIAMENRAEEVQTAWGKMLDPSKLPEGAQRVMSLLTGQGEGFDMTQFSGTNMMSMLGMDQMMEGSGFDYASLLQGMGGGMQGLGDSVSGIGDNIDLSGFKEKITTAFSEAGTEGGQKLVESIQTALTTGSEALRTSGTNSATEYLAGFTEALDTAGEQLRAKFETFGGDNAKAYADAIKSGLINTGSEIVITVTNGVEATIGKFSEEGYNMTVAFINGLIEIEEEVKTAGAEIGAAGVYGVTSQIGSMQQLGRNFAIGMAAGMNAAGSLIYQLAYSLGRKAVQAIKDATKTASPSKEAMAVGNYFGEGFAIGMDKTAHMVEKSSGNVGFTALKSLDSMLGMIEERMNANSVFEPKIRPVLDLTNLTGASDKVNALLNANPMMASTALGYASQMQAEIQRLTALNEQLQKNQNGTPTTVNLSVTTQELSNSTVDYLVNRVNKVLGGKV